jgi:hypothetical protein
MTVVRELSRYKLHLIGVQEVRWDKGTARAGDYTFFSMENGMNIVNWEECLLMVGCRV